VWKIKDDLEFSKPIVNPLKNINIKFIENKIYNISINNKVYDRILSSKFQRLSAQHAKNIILKDIRKAYESSLVKDFQIYRGKIIQGIVKKVNIDNIVIDIGLHAKAVLKKENMLVKESFRIGEKIKVYLKGISQHNRYFQFVVSRTCNGMLRNLLYQEIPEISNCEIQIRAMVRDPGLRSKIAVQSNNIRIDPIGSCVGVKGSRIQSISNELNGEKIDIILWSRNIKQFITNALSPAIIEYIYVKNNNIKIFVQDKFLSKVIGKRGQNIKLASDLIGLKLNIVNMKDYYFEKIKRVYMNLNILNKNSYINSETLYYIINHKKLI